MIWNYQKLYSSICCVILFYMYFWTVLLKMYCLINILFLHSVFDIYLLIIKSFVLVCIITVWYCNISYKYIYKWFVLGYCMYKFAYSLIICTVLLCAYTCTYYNFTRYYLVGQEKNDDSRKLIDRSYFSFSLWLSMFVIFYTYLLLRFSKV